MPRKKAYQAIGVLPFSWPDERIHNKTVPPGSLGVAALAAFLTFRPQMKTPGRYQKHLSPFILTDTSNIFITLSLPSVHDLFRSPDIPDMGFQRWLCSHIWHMLLFIAFKKPIVHMCVCIFSYICIRIYTVHISPF